jgi:acetylornithine/N-succinyldiaminopimelate aminotransferase
MNTNYPSVMPIAPRPDTVMVRGEGSRLWDADGREYLDFVQGWAVNCLGHASPVVREALMRQSERLINPSPAFYNQAMIDLSDRIVKLSGFDEVFLANSGAEANEGAIKLARKWGQLHKDGAYKIITMVNGFHGRTLATMSASGKPQWEHLYEPKVPGFIKVPFNDIDAVRSVVDAQTVAVMLEPIQGEGGVIPAQQEYLEQLRELTRREEVLLVFDEVQTGIGRTGELFAFQHYGVKPDVMTLGKGLGGGVPLAALVTTREFSCFQPGDQGGTYNGNPLMAAVGSAVIDAVGEAAFLDGVRERADYLHDELSTLNRKYRQNGIRGKGLLQAMVLSKPCAQQVVALAREQGLLLNAPREDVLRFMPALNVSTDDIDRMLGTLDGCLQYCLVG